MAQEPIDYSHDVEMKDIDINFCPFEIIPDEITLHILLALGELSTKSVLLAHSVCKKWEYMFSHKSFFKELCHIKYDLSKYRRHPEKSWKWVYLSKIPFTKANFTGIGSANINTNLVYEGEWENSQCDGVGICTWISGDQYVGEWSEGRRHGKGVMYWTTSDKYDGNWHHNDRTGYGTCYWSNGDKYEGEWKDNERTGYGVLTWASGHKYKGNWKNDLKDGFGTYTWPNKNQYTGTWVEGDRVSGDFYEAPSGRKFSIQHEDQEIHMEYMHPKVQECINRGICTYQYTGERCFFQYLWKTDQNDGRTHGVCVSCMEHCVRKNNIQIINPSCNYFGGVFFCECGGGYLKRPCTLLNNHDTWKVHRRQREQQLIEQAKAVKMLRTLINTDNK
jgi:hypothetical protein